MLAPQTRSRVSPLQPVCHETDTPYVHDQSRPLRVTHVIHDLRPGGAEHVLVDLAGVASAAGIELSVVSLLPVDQHDYAGRLSAAGVPVISLGLAGWWDARGPRRLDEVVRTLEPDVVHSHLKHADVVAGKVARKLGIPHVSTLHLIEDEVGWFGSRKRQVATRSRLETARMTIAVSDAVRDWYLASTDADPETVVTLRNGVPDPGVVDGEEANRIRGELGIGPTEVMAATIAVMRPGKGHDVLLDALPLIRAPVEFALAGDGACAMRLRQRVGESDRVHFLGFRDDIDRVLAASDLVVHPSLADALPTALVHALAAGRPIVATRVGGIPEIVAEDGGVLVPPNDADALAAAIDELAVDPDTMRLMGKHNRERYEAEFRAYRWARRLRQVYDSLENRS